MRYRILEGKIRVDSYLGEYLLEQVPRGEGNQSSAEIEP
jgi:hypothetical protein